jgi:hypothetical protein
MGLNINFDYKFSLKNVTEAIKWFKEQVKHLKKPTADEIKNNKIKQQELLKKGTNTTNKFEVGKMYLFHYNPKGRENLEYYDTFPLILLTSIKRDRFTGLNLHYLPVEPRMILLSNLLTKGVYKDGELERLNIKYENLQGVQQFSFFEPCFKQYLTSNVRSEIKLIPPEDWGFAASLPIEAFKKKTKQYVWKESMATQDMTL